MSARPMRAAAAPVMDPCPCLTPGSAGKSDNNNKNKIGGPGPGQGASSVSGGDQRSPREMKEGGAQDGAAGHGLLPLKAFLFFFFAGVGALLPFLPLHMRAAGLTARESRFLSAAAPLTALLGPLLAALVLDRRRRPPSDVQQDQGREPADVNLARQQGKKLRFLLAFTVLGAALCYCALLLVPTVTWFPARRPSVSFSCNGSGAAVLQERCMEPACYRWPEHEVGPLMLTNCEYECPDAAEAGSGRLRLGPDRGAGRGVGDSWRLPSDPPAATTRSNAGGEAPSERLSSSWHDAAHERGDPPHICVSEEGRDAGPRTCHVFTGSGAGITVNASLRQATNPDADLDQWCHYPVAEAFSCALPSEYGPSRCRVLCDIEHPYTAEGSVLAQSQCQVLLGDPVLTFWSYLLVRCVADAFPAAALVMVGSALLVASRAGNGVAGGTVRLGPLVAAGLVGGALAAPLAGLFSPYPAPGPSPAGWPPYGVPILGFAACMIVAAVILICSPMPVGAPDWWWDQKPGHRRSAAEAAALFLVLVLLGTFSSALDSYLPWRINGLRRLCEGDLAGLGLGFTPDLLLGLNVLLGLLPALPLLWRAESLVRYCGSSNILITAFTVYIVRYAGLSFTWSPWWMLLQEALETFMLSIAWVTAGLYFSQLLPRRLTASGQALAVAAYFGVGRSLGALLSGLLAPRDAVPPEDLDFQQLRPLYAGGAVAAAGVAVVYFAARHCRPKCCRASPGMGQGKAQQSRSVLAGQNLNGSYTPLRVYHGGRRGRNNDASV